MQKRKLGSTDIYTSVVGLGTVKFGRNQEVKYPAAYELPTDQELQILLEEAKSLGINLLDTAPAYGTSEERLGNLLQGTRHEWILSTKVGEQFKHGKSYFDFSKPTIVASIERSLQRLKTDFLDVVLVHSNGDDCKIIEEDNVFTTLAELKTSGKIRAFGMSTKTLEGGLATIEHADVAMVTYNILEKTDHLVILQAGKTRKGIFIKKALASGHLSHLGANPIQHSLSFALQEPAVSSVIIGTISATHLRENALAADCLAN